MRVLITGGNGYVGRTLTRLLVEDNEVGVLDNLEIGSMRLTRGDLSRIHFYESDIRDPDAVSSVMKSFRPDSVIHLAAIHFIPRCEQYPADAIATNVTGTVNVLRACPPRTRVIFASTAAVYAPEERPHNEDSPTGPMDVYGFTKLHAEQFVRYWTRMLELDAVIIRLFNVIGPGETNPHLLPAILAQALSSDGRLRLGNCHPKRDYIDVQDVAAGFAAVLKAPIRNPGVEVLNLGTGCAYSVYNIVEELERVAGSPFSIVTDPARVRESDRPLLVADTTRIRQRYGWSPQHNLASSLRALWLNPDIPQELLAVS